MTRPVAVSVSLINADKVGEAAERPYLSLYRLTAQTTYSDGTTSRPYPYDAVLRKWLDAVVIILTATINGEKSILLRSAVRPPMLIRHMAYTPLPDEPAPHILWELPAGLIEPGDDGLAGIIRRAAFETHEEAGYRIPASDFVLMKGAPFVTPGVLGERIWFAHADVSDIDERDHPAGDGSPIEDHAEIRWISLRGALQLCEAGDIDDMKTELGIRRAFAL